MILRLHFEHGLARQPFEPAAALLFSISISLGIAALIASACFARAWRKRSMSRRARSRRGSDRGSSRPFSAGGGKFLHSLGETQARETRFRRWRSFRRAAERGWFMCALWAATFPFYGKMETDPPAAATTFGAAARRCRRKVCSSNSEQTPATRSRSARPVHVAGALNKMPGKPRPRRASRLGSTFRCKISRRPICSSPAASRTIGIS